jgi:hypothetical protein
MFGGKITVRQQLRYITLQACLTETARRPSKYRDQMSGEYVINSR